MSAICPTPGSALRTRGRLAARAASGALAAVAATTALFALAPAANAAPAGPDDVQLTSVFAKPISSTEPQCTPEPAGRLIYGTAAPFDSGRALDTKGRGLPGNPAYIPANMRNKDMLTGQFQAGASNDLCFGFTLTPNMEVGVVRTTPTGGAGFRIQEDPPVPNRPGTRAWTAGTDEDLEDATIELPAGFAGDPDSLPSCSEEQFGLTNYLSVACPPNTVAGTVYARLTTDLKFDGGSLPTHLATGGFPNPTGNLSDGGIVYNLPHGPNELARLGVAIRPVPNILPTKFVVKLALSPEGRVRTVVEDAPKVAYYFDPDFPEDTITAEGQLLPGVIPSPLYLEALAIRAWGSADGHPTLTKDFAEWGTDCSASAKANMVIKTSLGNESSMDSNAFTMTGCESLPFLPAVDVTTTEKRPGVPTATNVKVTLGQTATGPRAALLKNAEVTLPPGLEIGAQVASGANGLPLCTAAQFAKTSPAANTCPAGTKAGDVTIITPLQSRPFVGAAYLGEQPAVGELPPLYLEVSPEGATAADAPRIKLTGSVQVDDNGKLTTTFLDAPQLRFSELRLAFPGGPNALFSTPRACGSYKSTSKFTSWASAAPVDVESSALVINEDCETPGFAPAFSMVPANNAVGAKSPTKVTIARADRSPWLKDIKVSLPSGFLSDLTVATECPAAAAATGACPESSRIATVTAQSGVGASPLALGGKMYLAERQEGSVAGAVIVVRAKIGELDLGDVVVPGKIDLRPTDAGLSLTTSAPLRFKGLALNMRSIVVDLDRENFPLNPTACGPLRAVAEITGDGGQTAAPTSDVTYAGCADLPFQPGFEAKLSGETGPKGHPQLDVTMTPRAGDSNLKGAKVVLPMGISTDLANLKNVCPLDAFNAGTCAANTVVGKVAVKVAITNDDIGGTVHLVRVEGTTLPGLGMNITGRYAQRVLSTVKIDKDSRVITEFPAIPDLPLRRLDLSVTGGAKSPLQISPAACKADTAWDVTLTGQGGKVHQVAQPVKCDAINVAKQSVTWSRKTGLKLTLTAPTGKTLKSAKITLPKGFKIKSGKARRQNLKVAVSGGKAKSKISSSSLAIVGSGAGPTKVTFTLKTKGYSLPKSYKNKLKKGKKIKLKSRIVLSDGNVTTSTSTIKAK